MIPDDVSPEVSPDVAAVAPAGIVVDALTEADAPRCAELEAILFPGDDPWSARAFRDELRAGHLYLGARDDGRLVGYGGVALMPGRLGHQAEPDGPAPLRSVSEPDGPAPLRSVSEPDGPAPLRSVSEPDGPAPLRSVSEAEIHTIGVDPAHQGRGIGRAVLDGLLAAADRIGATTYLEVRTDNVAAQHLYRATGFEVLGTRRRYYGSGADAYTMRRPPGGDPPAPAPR